MELPDRRQVLLTTVAGASAIALGCRAASAGGARSQGAPSAAGAAQAGASPFVLPPLPYPEDALEPVMSARTLSFHYGKHHKAYVDNLNGLVKADPALASMPLEDLIRKVQGDAAKASVFNNAAQVWNHTFFWHSMEQKGGGKPGGRILAALEASFGGYDQFKTAFSEAAKTQFGSGWAWLIEDGGKLAVVKSGNADTPMAHGKKCLLTLDVWEHAYYLDHQNRRPDYITAWLDSLVNWDFVQQNLG